MVESTIDIASAIQAKLLLVPELVCKFENKDIYALQDWLAWIKDSEALLKKYNFAECAEIAGLHALICHEELKIYTDKRIKKKTVIAQAVSTVNPSQQILQNIYNRLQEKIENVRVVMKQILVVAKSAGLLNFNSEKETFTQFLQSLLNQFKSHVQLAPSINSAIASIGRFDVIRILAEEISFE